MLLPEVQLVPKTSSSKVVCKEALKKTKKKPTKSYFIRGGVISYVVVTSFFCHRLMLTLHRAHCNGGS